MYGNDNCAEPWNTLSIVVGWTYLVAWSASFFPQAIENYQRKSVAGFSIEFAMLNPSGFFFYTLYSVGGRIDGSQLGTGKVAWNDLAFAILAFSMSSVQLVQVFMYDRGTQGNIQWWVIIFLSVLFAAVFGTFIAEAAGAQISTSWDTLLVAGYAKAAITFVKYCP